jgi:AAA15 family ATPase/GTPase
MTIDAIITMMVLPYTINIETKDQELEKLHQNISLSTEPIISLETLKQTFDIDKYKVQTHPVWQEPVLKPGVDNSTLSLSVDVKEALRRIKDRAMIKEGKQYIELTKEDIKQLFPLELYRDKQLNKILDDKK